MNFDVTRMLEEQGEIMNYFEILDMGITPSCGTLKAEHGFYAPGVEWVLPVLGFCLSL